MKNEGVKVEWYEKNKGRKKVEDRIDMVDMKK